MQDCHLKHTSDSVVATCGYMPRLIPPASFQEIHCYLKCGYSYTNSRTNILT